MDQPSTPDTFLIRDVRIFTGDATIPNGYLHVSSGKIQSLGPVSSIPDIPSIPNYSKPGHTLLPGLIDCHIHADLGNPSALPQALRFGVTTVCEMHNELTNVLKLRAQALTPDTAAYKTAGQAATIENGWPIPVITAHDKSPETAAEIAKWPKLSNRENVVEYLEWTARTMQPDYIKLMHESGAAMGWPLAKPAPELQQVIVEEAKRRGYQVVAHATSLQDTLEVLEAGVDGLTHTMCDQEPTRELVEAYKRTGAWVNPTLVAMGSLTGEGRELQRRFAHDPRVREWIGEAEMESLCNCMGFCAQHGKTEYAYQSVRMLKEAGVDILCGSDSAGPAVGTAFGLSMHHELYLYVHKVGMTPEEALRSATSLVAKCFKFEDRGRLAVGLNADLLLVEGNPLEDIDATLNIRGVWREGRICSTHASTMGDGL